MPQRAPDITWLHKHARCPKVHCLTAQSWSHAYGRTACRHELWSCRSRQKLRSPLIPYCSGRRYLGRLAKNNSSQFASLQFWGLVHVCMAFASLASIAKSCLHMNRPLHLSKLRSKLRLTRMQTGVFYTHLWIRSAVPASLPCAQAGLFSFTAARDRCFLSEFLLKASGFVPLIVEALLSAVHCNGQRVSDQGL